MCTAPVGVSGEGQGYIWLMLWSQHTQPNMVNAHRSTKLESEHAFHLHRWNACWHSVQLICNSRGLQFSPPFAGSSKLGRVLDHVSLIESEPPGPETEVLSEASQKQVQKSGVTSPPAAVTRPLVLVRSIAPILTKLVLKIHRPPESKALTLKLKQLCS